MKRLTRTFKKVEIKRSEKAGLPPGSLIYTGIKQKSEPVITIIDYSKEDYSIQKFNEVSEDLSKIDEGKLRWINVEGIGFVEIVEKIGNQFNHHPLLMEDILSVSQRPKVDVFKDHIAVFIRILNLNNDEIEYEQTCLILGKNFLLSFEENENQVFKPIRDRIVIPRGKVREMRVDYLLYTLIDVIIDNYFIILARFGEKIADLEIKLIEEQDKTLLSKIHILRRDILELRRYIWPLREIVNRLRKEVIPLIDESVQLFFGDVYDHLTQVSDRIDNFRDILTGLIDIYQSQISNRMNEVINLLTIIMTIFIPLSFLAGFFGMNYILPDPNANNNLFTIGVITSVMIFIGIVMIYFFKKKKWI